MVMHASVADVKKVDDANQKALKAVKSGSKIEYHYVRPFLVLGTPTDAFVRGFLQQMAHEPGYCRGTIEVLREPIRGKGELKATRPKSDQAEFKTRLNAISKKQVFIE
jgi:hypothetical protein